MPQIGKANKQPFDTYDYDIPYEDWLPEGDAIQSATATFQCLEVPTDNTLSIDFVVVPDPQTVKVWLSGGTSQRSYKITVRVITEDGRRDECEFIIKVRDT